MQKSVVSAQILANVPTFNGLKESANHKIQQYSDQN